MTLSGLGRRFLDFIFPPVCALCENALPPVSGTPVCPACWDSCKSPDPATPSFMGAGHQFTRAFSLYPFNATFQKLVHLLKYDRKPSIGRALGRHLADAVPQSFLADFTLAVPVPVHHTRRRERGYNQAEVIARAFSERRGLPVDAKVLVRVRSTGTQTELSREERKKNIAGAFKAKRPLNGKRVILIDDVLTTGATLDECAKVLKEAGASEVRVLTAARVE